LDEEETLLDLSVDLNERGKYAIAESS